MTDAPKRPPSPHDALFKRTFSDVENARVELAAVLPPALVAALDLSTLEVVPGTFVDELYSQRYSDLLYRTLFDGREALLYVLYEHLSNVERIIALRLLGYLVRILEEHIKNKGKGLPLPVVIPIVLHHSDSGWTAPTNLHSLFDPEALAIPGVRELVPEFRFLLDDVSRMSNEELRRRASSDAGEIVSVVLWAMRSGRRSHVAREVPEWADVFRRIFQQQRGRDALLEIFRYLSRINEELTRNELIVVAEEIGPETKEVVMTLAEQWIAEGEARGRLDGEAKGRLDGERRILERFLHLKFGQVPEDIRHRLARANENELTTWTERVVSARSLGEVFG